MNRLHEWFTNTGEAMKFTLPEETFLPVNLSKEKQAALIEEAETVIRQTIAANEEFIAGGATFQDPKWKLVRAKEGLRVVVKKMTVDVSSTGSVKQCALRFCLGCLLEAKVKSVWELALSGVETSSECSSTSSSE
ncbi:hypothetical protein PF011_g19033 [Phytophthora fragariae]|uniref:Uncharacterized protein n=1 Tax=Phytophthora fragariae TaxID=53985 RepID=A0A6A3J3D9_9STRA|nr:hypothetical protein PF011_g19033 [Phytophthora fragariae]